MLPSLSITIGSHLSNNQLLPSGIKPLWCSKRRLITQGALRTGFHVRYLFTVVYKIAVHSINCEYSEKVESKLIKNEENECSVQRGFNALLLFPLKIFFHSLSIVVHWLVENRHLFSH